MKDRKKELGEILIDVESDLKGDYPHELRSMGYYVEGDWPVLRYKDKKIMEAFSDGIKE